ncbi:MAG: DNA replication and repair protein RecF [Deinococcota bacterium]|nr:DNA replication and repair protein RecF [Deinococcota bacterium]
MLLRALSQLNYRNLVTPRLDFGPGVTAVVGGNAEGKSNLLEAAYLGCSGDLPGGRIAEVIRLGEEEGFVSARVERADGLVTTQIGLAPGKKLIRLDGQTVRAMELARVSAAVLITPEDAGLVHGAPSLRRGYLDSLLSRLSLRYAVLLREYTRVVEQRNAMLKGPVDELGLEVWSARFSELGGEIARLRGRAVARISEIAGATYRDISGGTKALGVALRQPSDKSLDEALHETRFDERARGATVVGPHRDDLLLELGGHALAAYGSRGEARTAALALRVAEYRLLGEKHGEAPVLLLDDFTAELDEGRRAYLLALTEATPQALVSGTEAPPTYSRLLSISGGGLLGD